MSTATETRYLPGNVIWRGMSLHTKMYCGVRKATLIEDGLRFKVGGKPMRYIEVTLDGGDLYTVCYYRLKRGTYERIVLDVATGIYASMLDEVLCKAVCK